jgi:hypothetical protein
MKRCLYILLLLLPATCGAQSLATDLRRDWYGIVPTVDMSILDTIVLYPVQGNFDQHKDIFLWRYLGGKDYQLKIYNNTMPGSYENYELAPEHWQLKQKGDSVYYLTVKDRHDPKPFHKKVAAYMLMPHRDSYNILTRITLVKVYDNRYTEQLKIPSLRN